MRFISALVAILVSVPCGSHADDLQSAMGRYIAWRGGTAFEAMHSFHERGATQLGGLHGSVEQWQTRDGLLRRNSNLGEIPTSEAVTPSVAWAVNISGQIEDISDDGESDRRAVYMAFAGAALAHGAKFSLLAREQRDNRTWDVVRAEFPGNNTYDQFISPDTGELLGMRVTKDRQTRFVLFADWRKVHGVRMAFSEVETGSNEADVETRNFTAIDINVATPMRLFARPVSPKNWSFASDSHATEWIDFEFFNDNQIFIPAEVNGSAVKLILDSGAGISLIDSGLAKRIGVQANGKLPISGVGGQATMQIASQIQIQLAGLAFRHIRAGVMDLSQISEQVGHPMPFILGKEVFNELIIDIDFAHHRIAFRDPAAFSAPPGAAQIALGRHQDRRTIPVSVEGRAAVSFDFDLGNNGALIVYPAYRDEANLLDGRPQSLGLSAGVGGLIKSKLATLKSITVSGIEIAAVPTEFPDAADNAVNSDRTAGNIGLTVFSRFRLLTDYPHDALWLIPDAEHLRDPFVRDRSGLAAVPAKDRLKVLMVAPGSPAERAGLKEGAEILAVDGKQIDAGYSGSDLSRWTHHAPGTVVKLTLADGSIQQLTLQDYY
ncbi:MAG TPA: aspartyl protease family protein [Steroidobacteraceae bacterium]|nr:aspartyl protease family protein [Steroidobacteraceae bacterium]